MGSGVERGALRAQRVLTLHITSDGACEMAARVCRQGAVRARHGGAPARRRMHQEKAAALDDLT